MNRINTKNSILPQDRAKAFEKMTGRYPRILLPDDGTNSDKNEIKIIASAYADVGFVVDIGPSFQSLRAVARMAAENDVHVIGFWETGDRQKQIKADLENALALEDAEDIKVIFVNSKSIDNNNALEMETVIRTLDAIGA